MQNKFPGSCHRCSLRVAAQQGECLKIDGAWRVQCAGGACEKSAAPAAPKANVGELGGVLALFAKASQRLKYPAIVLGVPALGPEFSVRLTVAGSRAKVPGSLTLTSGERDGDGREWYGRILLDGTFQPSAAAPAAALAQRLAAFAADPAKVGGDDGRLHGRCCFCRLPLSDERSTAVGYGKKCASNFGLAWGAAKFEFKAEGVAA